VEDREVNTSKQKECSGVSSVFCSSAVYVYIYYPSYHIEVGSVSLLRLLERKKDIPLPMAQEWIEYGYHTSIITAMYCWLRRFDAPTARIL
jgi:hypothetical protein